MKKLLLITTVFVINTQVSNAQLALGPEVGLNISSMPTSASISSSSVTGFKIGAIVDLGITKKLSLQPGIFYTVKGGKNSLGAAYTQTKVNYLEIPVNVQYDIVDVKVVRIFAGAGPYFGYALSGKMESKLLTTTEEDLKIGTDSTDYIKPTDFGVNVNAGAMLGFGLFVRLQYGFGLANTASVPDANTIKNGSFSVSVGYLLGRKR